MRNFFVLSILFLGLFSCDDGDIITTELDFEDTFEACGDLVLYKVKTDPNETFSLQLSSPGYTIADLVETEIDPDNSLLVNLVLSTKSISTVAGKLKFRSYTSNPTDFFCNDVPVNGIEITEEYTATNGTAYFTMELLEDDNDGIPAELEDDNLDGDNDHTTNPLDTDGDGLPNYLDVDDDGDNVLTSSESANYTEDDGLSNALDTDADGTPNYLDNDDDGDGTLTRNEDENEDLNPTNDYTGTDNPDYLNTDITEPTIATAYRSHTIQQTFTVELFFEDIQFPEIIYEETSFGTLSTFSVDGDDILSTSRTVTPPFN